MSVFVLLMSPVVDSTPNAQRPTTNIQVRDSGELMVKRLTILNFRTFGCWLSGVGRWALGVEYSVVPIFCITDCTTGNCVCRLNGPGEECVCICACFVSALNARTATRTVDEWDPLFSSSALVAVLVDRFPVFITFDSTVFGYLSLICSSTLKKARGTTDHTDGTDTKRNQPRITSVLSAGGWPVF
jgi:hypothetical protein